jgi:hypothetical protein
MYRRNFMCRQLRAQVRHAQPTAVLTRANYFIIQYRHRLPIISTATPNPIGFYFYAEPLVLSSLSSAAQSAPGTI